MDPFEARLQFSKMLSTIQPISQSLGKCTTFALRNFEYQDDLHSCILEVLKTCHLNIKLNILNFIESLINQSQKSFKDNAPYINNIKRDLPQIISKVTPATQQGLYNLIMCFDLLCAIAKLLKVSEVEIKAQRELFESDLLSEEEKMEAKTADIDTINRKILQNDTDIKPGIEGAWQILVGRKKMSQFITLVGTYKGKLEQISSNSDLTKEQKITRMEFDRERHKKAKESLWTQEREAPGKPDRKEFLKLWESCSPISEGYLKELAELNEVVKVSYGEGFT